MLNASIKWAALQILGCISLTLAFASHCHSQSKASALHNNAWSSVALSAVNNSADRYALYGSRTIAVSHPEIYLRADLKMLKWMSTHPNVAVATGRPSPVRLNLSWNALQNLRTSKAKDVYPSNAPFLDFVDRRLLPPTAVLRQLKIVDGDLVISNHQAVTEFSKAILAYYFKQKKGPYVLYCSNESAFLLLGDAAISMKNLQMGAVDCDPILIFNKSHVWYPIMGRDDTKVAKGLAVQVKAHVKSDGLVKLDPSQFQLIEILKQSTQLSSGQDEGMVKLVALNTTPILYLDDSAKLKVENQENFVKWQAVLPDINVLDEFTIQRIHTGISSFILQDIHINSNRLSPMTAHMAAQLINKRTKEAAKTLSKNYSDYFHWGEVWLWGLTDFTIDESLSAGGGGVCVTHSNNIDAVLSLADVDHYTIHTYDRGKNKDHRIVYVPSWKATFSNGILSKESGKTIFDPPQFHSIVYLRHGNKWAFFAPPVFLGNMEGGEVFSHLNFLGSEFNDTLGGVAISPQWINAEKPMPIGFNALTRFLLSTRPISGSKLLLPTKYAIP